jgi:CRP/FNR family transcriptional regulator
MPQALTATAVAGTLVLQALSELGHRAHHRLYRQGDVIFRQGDIPTHLYFVRSGLVKSVVSSAMGRDVITELHFPGELCGSLSALDGQPYAATAICLQDCEITVVPLDLFLRLVEKQPALLLGTVQACRRSMRFQREMMVGIAVEPAESRAARTLLMLAERLGVETPAGVSFPMPLTRQEFSELIGTTVETGIRILSRFRKAGIISESGNEVIILKKGELLDLAFA